MGLTDFILAYRGCPKGSTLRGCMGPTEQWFFMNLPLKLYPSIMLYSLFLALFVSAIILSIKHNDLTVRKIIKFFIIAFVISLVLVYLYFLWSQSTIVY